MKKHVTDSKFVQLVTSVIDANRTCEDGRRTRKCKYVYKQSRHFILVLD